MLLDCENVVVLKLKFADDDFFVLFFSDPNLTGIKDLCVCVCYFSVDLQIIPLLSYSVDHNVVVVVSRKEQQSLYGLLHLYPFFFFKTEWAVVREALQSRTVV